MRDFFQTHVPKHILLIILLGVIVVFTTMLTTLQDLEQKTEMLNTAEAQFEALHRTYSGIELEASSVIVYDATHNTILYALRPTERRPIASITKIMTALVGRTILSSETPITITSADRTEEPDLGLRMNDTWTTKNLIQYFLVKSSNDGADAVCNAVTSLIKKNEPQITCPMLMNRYAKNQGLSSLYFANPSGLDLPSGAPSNFGSAYDVARLLRLAYISYPGLFAVTNQPTVTFKTAKYEYEAVNTDKVLEEIGTVLAGKTGYTDTAGGNLAVLYEPRPGLQIAIVVLGSSREGRFSDMLELVRRTNKYIAAYKL